MPALESRAVVIEFSHRLMASVVVILVAVLAGLAVRHMRHQRRLLWPSLVALGLVLSQAALGAVVVWLELEATSVVAHLALALSLLAVLVYVTAAAAAADGQLAPQPDGPLARRSAGVAVGVFTLLLVGSYVTGRDAGLVFADWPLMNGRLVPDLSIEPYAIHFLHRALAAVVGVVVLLHAIAVIKRKRELRSQAQLAYAAAGLFALEIVIGAFNVWTDLNPAVVTLHLLVGAGIWAAVVGITVLSHPSLQRVRDAAPVRTRPAYEAS